MVAAMTTLAWVWGWFGFFELAFYWVLFWDWFWVGFMMSFHICLSWFVLFDFLEFWWVGFFRFLMSWICDEFLVWVCFGLSRGREKESQGQRKRRGGWKRREKIYLNNEMESYSNRVYLHSYCSIFVYAQY